MYVYIQIKEVWTVGFYKPDGSWYAESSWIDQEYAATRVQWLNGGSWHIGLDGELSRTGLPC